MKKLTILGLSLVGLTITLCATLLSQQLIPAKVSGTPLGVGEVIEIKGTTDGQPISSSFIAEDYSSDGNTILFTSNASNLPNANTRYGSYVRGLYTYSVKEESIKRVDISTAGIPGDDGVTGSFKISETGRYVSFGTMATNLIDGVTKNPRTTYKRDLQLGVTSPIGAGDTSMSGAVNWDQNQDISSDGRFSLITSRGLVVQPPYASFYVALGDGSGEPYTWKSIVASGQYGQYASRVSRMNCSGTFVVYVDYSDVKLADTRGGNIINTNIGSGTSVSPLISCNGRYILYATTNRTDITPSPSGINGKLHLVRYDRISGERQYVDINSTGTFSNGVTLDVHNGNYMPNAFSASIADTGDVVLQYNGVSHLKRLSDGSNSLEKVAKTTAGTPIDATGAVITKNGRYIFFREDPATLGLTATSTGSQIIRVQTNL